MHECPTAAISAMNIDRRSTSIDVHTLHDPTPSGGTGISAAKEPDDDEEAPAA